MPILEYALENAFKQAFLLAVEGEQFDAAKAAQAVRDGFDSAMLFFKGKRDENKMDRLADLAQKINEEFE